MHLESRAMKWKISILRQIAKATGAIDCLQAGLGMDRRVSQSFEELGVLLLDDTKSKDDGRDPSSFVSEDAKDERDKNHS